MLLSTSMDYSQDFSVHSEFHKSSETEVLAFRQFNALKVMTPKNRELRRAIESSLTIHRRVSYKERGKLKFDLEPEPCFEVFGSDANPNQMYMMGAGFVPRLQKLLEARGVTLNIIDQTPTSKASLIRLLADPKEIERIPWRDNQRDIVNDMLTNFRGQYIAPAGSGKSFLIRHLFHVFKNAKILVTTYSAAVLRQMWESVVKHGDVDAGLLSSKGSAHGSRGMFVSLDSLHRVADQTWDAMLLDERHEACTLKRMAKLLAVRTRRAYGFSADESDRPDNADMWTEAMFGEVRSRYLFKDAVSQGDIVTVKVEWVKTLIPRFPQDLQAGSPQYERTAVWRNEARNELIRKKALESIEKYGQTLIYVKTVEHALVLRKLLDCPVACGSVTYERMQELKGARIVEPDYEAPSERERMDLQREFAKGEVPLVICTSVWKRGVDFPGLRCVIRADAGSSPEDSVQIPGRVTRRFPGKTEGHLIDFDDQFHPPLQRRAFARRAIYKREEFKQ